MTDKGISKPSTSEDEYFVREDAEKKRKIALEMKKALATEEQARLKELHSMSCPKCGLKLQQVRFRSVDVDACFSCGGLFIDKGQVDRIAKPEGRGVMWAVLNWFKEQVERPIG
jgi:uncharacterized protein